MCLSYAVIPANTHAAYLFFYLQCGWSQIWRGREELKVNHFSVLLLQLCLGNVWGVFSLYALDTLPECWVSICPQSYFLLGSGFYKPEKDFALMRWCFTYSTALIKSYGVESQTNTLTVTLLRVTMWICFCLLSAGWLPTLQNIIKKQTVWRPCINCFNQLKTSSETRWTHLRLERAHFPLQI